MSSITFQFELSHGMSLVVQVPDRPYTAEQYVERITTDFAGICYVKGFCGPGPGVYSMIFEKRIGAEA